MQAKENKEVVLSTNPVLNSLANEFSNSKPDWVQIVELYKSKLSVFPHKGKLESNLSGILAELHLETFLKNKETANEFNARGQSGKKFKFQPGRLGALVATERETGNNYVEYDLINQVDDLLVVWEIKLSGSTRPGNEADFKEINRVLREERLQRLYNPLQDCLNIQRFGYVVVAPSDYYSPHEDVQAEFRQRGGIIVPYYTDTLTHKLNSLAVKTKYRL